MSFCFCSRTAASTQCFAHRAKLGFAYPSRRSTSLLVRRREWVSSPLANTLVPLPKNSTSFILSNFFIHCESNGISSRVSVYLIRFDEHISSKRVYHQPKAVFAFAMMIYTAPAVIWRESLAIFPILCYTNIRKVEGI